MGKRTVVAAVAIAATVPPLAVGGAGLARADTTPSAGFSTTIEAEDWLAGNGATVVHCGACSGAKRVAGLGGHDNGVLTIYVRIPEEADYTVTVYYVSDRKRDLSINERRLTGLDSGGWHKVAKRSIKLHLREKFGRPAVIDLGYDTGTKAVDVDKVVIRSAGR
jgi:hypothetical protein